MNSSELIEKILKEQDITQSELAKLLDVQEGTLSRWKNGIYPASLQALCLMSHFFKSPLVDAVDYESFVKPYDQVLQLRGEWQPSTGYPVAENEHYLAHALAVAEHFQEGPVSFTQLLQDASLSQYEISGTLAREPFSTGDLVFYKKESALSEGFVLFRNEQNEVELLFLQFKGREIYLKSLDVQGKLLNYGKEGRKAGQLLGHVYYIVRRFRDVLPL